MLGIGGGGDAFSALALYLELKAAGARPLLGGISWKRRIHDPAARPRRIEEFDKITRISEYIGLSSPATAVKDGPRHIEAEISELLNGEQVLTLDISPGARRVFEDLEGFLNAHDVENLIGVDAGGDVLCAGSEKRTIESPLCDQIMLAAMSKLPGSLLALVGLGSDGELPFADFLPRFHMLKKAGALYDVFPIDGEAVAFLGAHASEVKTESSRYPVEIAGEIGEKQLASICERIRSGAEPPELLLNQMRKVPLRNGARCGELTPLTGCVLLFDAQAVYCSNQFSKLMDEDADLFSLHGIFHAQGYKTEFTEA